MMMRAEEIFMSKLALRRKIYNFDEKCWIFRDFWVKIGFSHHKIPSKNPSTIFSPFNFFKHIKSFKHFESHYFFNLSTTWNLPPRWKIINLSSQIGFQCGKFSSKEFFSHRADLKSIFYFSIYFSADDVENGARERGKEGGLGLFSQRRSKSTPIFFLFSLCGRDFHLLSLKNFF